MDKSIIKVKAISVREKDELEPLLVKNPGIIEEGLRILTHELTTDSGPLDILAVDSSGTLVVIELKNEASEGHLDQGLRYYDWCCQNTSWIASAFKDKGKIDALARPRLMLIAPAFSETVKRIAKYVDAELQLIEYHAFENEKKEKGLICSEIDFGEAVSPAGIPSIEKKMEHFESDKAKAVFVKALKKLEQVEVEAKPIHGQWVSLWYRGKRFVHVAVRKKCFVVRVLQPGGGWSPKVRVSRQKEWDAVFQKDVLTFMEYLKSQG